MKVNHKPGAAIIYNKEVSGPEERKIPAHLCFGKYLFDRFKCGGDKIAIICGETGDSVTYQYILQTSVNLATALRDIGLKKGDVVALSSENRFEFIITALAIQFCGAIISTLNATYSPGEISHIFGITKPKFIFASPITAQNIYDCSKDLHYVKKLILFGEYDVVPAIFYNSLIMKHINVDDFILADVNGVEDTAAIMCSSGTTGLPKGVMLTHVNLLTSCSHMKFNLKSFQAQKKIEVKTALSLIPWYHAYGFNSVLAFTSLFVEVVFLPRFEEKQFLETIQNYKINTMTIVPPLAVFLAKHPLVLKYNLTSLNEVWCAAAPLSKEIQKAVSDRIGISSIRQGYGLTEMTMACCVDMSHGEKVGTCGTPAPGIKIKVLDIETRAKLGPGQQGELWIKSSLRMKGYLGNSEASDAMLDAEGYMRTGDIGYYDIDGFFYIVDRLKELIKYKGFQVPPAELEALLLRHSGVAECGVVGTPHEVAGELPTAFVVPAPHSTTTADELMDYIASKVSPPKRLRGGVFFIKEIPKNTSGKILRRELKKLLEKPNSKL